MALEQPPYYQCRSHLAHSKDLLSRYSSSIVLYQQRFTLQTGTTRAEQDVEVHCLLTPWYSITHGLLATHMQLTLLGPIADIYFQLHDVTSGNVLGT